MCGLNTKTVVAPCIFLMKTFKFNQNAIYLNKKGIGVFEVCKLNAGTHGLLRYSPRSIISVEDLH
jgi:hypothetical protein